MCWGPTCGTGTLCAFTLVPTKCGWHKIRPRLANNVTNEHKERQRDTESCRDFCMQWMYVGFKCTCSSLCKKTSTSVNIYKSWLYLSVFTLHTHIHKHTHSCTWGDFSNPKWICLLYHLNLELKFICACLRFCFSAQHFSDHEVAHCELSHRCWLKGKQNEALVLRPPKMLREALVCSLSERSDLFWMHWIRWLISLYSGAVLKTLGFESYLHLLEPILCH